MTRCLSPLLPNRGSGRKFSLCACMFFKRWNRTRVQFVRCSVVAVVVEESLGPLEGVLWPLGGSSVGGRGWVCSCRGRGSWACRGQDGIFGLTQDCSVFLLVGMGMWGRKWLGRGWAWIVIDIRVDFWCQSMGVLPFLGCSGARCGHPL